MNNIGLALQGGGSHGAFSWGVLDRLLELEEKNLGFESVCGTSAGAVNAVVMTYGIHIGGRMKAKELLEKGISFKWHTNNPKKVGRDIYGVKLEDEQQIDFESSQLILAISSPEDQLVVRNRLNELQKINNHDYCWLF